MAFETADRSELYPNQPGSAWLARIGACTLGLHIESKEILSMHWNMHLQKHRKIRGLDSRPKICWKNGFFNRKPWLLDRRTSEPPVGFKALLARAKPSAKPRKDGWQMLWYHVGVSKNRGTPKCMVHNGKPLLKWMIWGVPLFSETFM